MGFWFVQALFVFCYFFKVEMTMTKFIRSDSSAIWHLYACLYNFYLHYGLLTDDIFYRKWRFFQLMIWMLHSTILLTRTTKWLSILVSSTTLKKRVWVFHSILLLKFLWRKLGGSLGMTLKVTWASFSLISMLTILWFLLLVPVSHVSSFRIGLLMLTLLFFYAE